MSARWGGGEGEGGRGRDFGSGGDTALGLRGRLIPLGESAVLRQLVQFGRTYRSPGLRPDTGESPFFFFRTNYLEAESEGMYRVYESSYALVNSLLIHARVRVMNHDL